MIKVNKGDLLSVKSGIIIHGCNAQSVMGSGVALAIKRKYPSAFQAYIDEYNNNGGKLYLGTYSIAQVAPDLKIINAVTQEYYGRDNKRYVNYAAIAECFKSAITEACINDCDLHFPMIGAGLGGGDWSIIEQIINDCDPKDTISKNLWVL